MKYDELSIGERIAVTFLIVLVILFALALFGYLSGRWDSADAQSLPPSKYDERIATLDVEAVEAAYKSHIENLFQIWVKSPEGQPARAMTGARNARRAFIGAMDAIEKNRAERK